MKVSVGLGTKLGLAGTLVASLIAVVESVQDNQQLLTGNNKAAGIIAFSVLVLTKLGRMYQAAHLPGGDEVAGVTDKLPDELAALAAEAQANVAKVQASPDGIDGPHVAYSTESAGPDAEAVPPAQG